jgi:hypothetical protein
MNFGVIFATLLAPSNFIGANNAPVTFATNTTMKNKRNDIRAASRNRIEYVKCWCRFCWRKIEFTFQWSEMQGWTVEDMRQACERLHAKTCEHPDIRLV